MAEQRYTTPDGGVYVFSDPFPAPNNPSVMVVTITFDKPGNHSSMTIAESKVDEFKRRKGLIQ